MRLIHFTPRTRQVAELVLSGYRSKEIAERLGVKIRTIKSYLNRMYLQFDMVEEVGCSANRVKLATYLYEHRDGLGLTYMAPERSPRPRKESPRSLQRAARIMKLEAELEYLRALSSSD